MAIERIIIRANRLPLKQLSDGKESCARVVYASEILASQTVNDRFENPPPSPQLK